MGINMNQELPTYNFEKLAIATNNFHLDNKLGKGGFGPVYKVASLLDHYCTFINVFFFVANYFVIIVYYVLFNREGWWMAKK